MKDISKEVESIYDGFDNTLIVEGRDFRVLSGSSIPIIGYCSKYEGIYHVVYPVTRDERLNSTIKMHEYGHIYLGHLEGVHEEMDFNLRKLIRNKDSQLIDQVNESCGIDYAEDILDKVISDPYLNHSIHNIAMDLEINSTILNLDDVEYIKERMNELIYEEFVELSEHGKKLPDMRSMSNLMSKYDMKGVHPSQFEFSEGLTYPDYLVLLILNLDKVVRELSNQYNDKDKFKEYIKSKGSESGNKGEEDSDGSYGSSESEGDENRNIPKTKEEFEEMIRNSVGVASDNGNDENNSNPNSSGSSGNSRNDSSKDDTDSKGSSGNSKSSSDEENDATMDHGTDSRKEADGKRKTDLGNYASDGGSGRGLNRSTSVRDYVLNNDPLTMSLKEILRDVRHKVIKRDYSKDMTYKYNRKILGKDNRMLHPTYRQKITRSENPTLAFFIDVSGSMNTSLVDRIITTIRKGMKDIDRSLKYSIITWDEELCEYYKDLDFNTPIPKISCGGGTRMAGTFDLFKKDFGIDAIMVLVSDFGDNLDEWHMKEQEMNGYSMYGLKYGNDTWYNGGVQPDWKNFKVRQCD